MNENIQEILKIWHNTFKDEEKQYSEYESSDIDYFVACMLYNKFDFKNALDTMKTIDLSYDFLLSVEDTYDEVKSKIDKIEIKDELTNISLLLSFLDDAKLKYKEDELYLINRLYYHTLEIKKRYEANAEVDKSDFTLPKARSKNPLEYM